MHGCLRKIHEDILVCWNADLYMSVSDSHLLTVAMICVHAHMHTHTCTHAHSTQHTAHMHTCTHAHTHTCTHTHTHTCTHAHTHRHSQLWFLCCQHFWHHCSSCHDNKECLTLIGHHMLQQHHHLQHNLWRLESEIFLFLKSAANKKERKNTIVKKMRSTSHNIASLH